MRTTFVTPPAYASVILQMARTINATGTQRPERFKKVMRENRGNIGALSCYGPGEDGLDRKNPLIVALGDSVTAGHFEFLGDMEELFAKIDSGTMGENEAVEVTDARECYLEKFRALLIDRYEQTSVSTINSGIAGDTMIGMNRRLERDVIRYQPDLVIINGSLNWGSDCGDTKAYEDVLREVVQRVKEETCADIILLTSNMVSPGPFVNPASSLQERTEVIRSLASEQKVCLADAYRIWQSYQEAGYPISALLANGANHPSVTGHEVYAHVLMQLMD